MSNLSSSFSSPSWNAPDYRKSIALHRQSKSHDPEDTRKNEDKGNKSYKVHKIPPSPSADSEHGTASRKQNTIKVRSLSSYPHDSNSFRPLYSSATHHENTVYSQDHYQNVKKKESRPRGFLINEESSKGSLAFRQILHNGWRTKNSTSSTYALPYTTSKKCSTKFDENNHLSTKDFSHREKGLDRFCQTHHHCFVQPTTKTSKKHKSLNVVEGLSFTKNENKFLSCHRETSLPSQFCDLNYSRKSIPFGRKYDYNCQHHQKPILRLPNSSGSVTLSSHPHHFIIPIGDPKYQIYRLKLPPDLVHLLHPILNLIKKSVNIWETNLYSLTKQDVALNDVLGAYSLAVPIVNHIKYILDILYTEKGKSWRGDKFGIGNQKGEIIMDQNQPHILKYSVETRHTGVRLHHDNCDYTVNLMMSKRNEYDGGGTYFADPREIVMLDYGEFIVHPGKRVHCGVDITRGSRYLMVMFANLADKRFALL